MRELENRIRRGAIMAEGRFVEPADLELAVPDMKILDLRSARQNAERDAIHQALLHSEGSIAAAAKLLGVSRPTLYALIDTLSMAEDLKLRAGQGQDETITESEDQ